MGKELKKWKRKKSAFKQIDEIEKKRDSALVIHYSCESFYDIQDGHTPRVTSIVIRNYSTGQTASFSIHKSAEQQGASVNEIDGRYDEFERHMLNEYFDFIKSRHGYTFIHWNMRDINYGFQAIEHRFRVLGGEPFIIDDLRKFDLARALIAIYGVGYIGHKPNGRLHNLIELNKITSRDTLTGAEEAEAFENKEFVKLHQSTLRKADILSNILERTVDGSIKTKATWWEIHGIHPSILVEVVTKHWLWVLFTAIAAIVGIVAAVNGFF
jgi:hypothetical protein